MLTIIATHHDAVKKIVAIVADIFLRGVLTVVLLGEGEIWK
jgi:hypothetical protein